MVKNILLYLYSEYQYDISCPKKCDVPRPVSVAGDDALLIEFPSPRLLYILHLMTFHKMLRFLLQGPLVFLLLRLLICLFILLSDAKLQQTDCLREQTLLVFVI